MKKPDFQNGFKLSVTDLAVLEVGR